MSYQHGAGRIAHCLILLVAALSGSCAATRCRQPAKQYAADYQPWLVDTRRALHSKPELMYEEHETSEFIRKALDKMTIDYR